MYDLVDVRDSRVLTLNQFTVCFNPCGLEFIEPLSATFGAWPVPCCECGCFINEEQLRVRIWRKGPTLSTLEFNLASDPRFASPLSNDLLLVIVKNAAISKQSAFGGDGTQLPPWVDTILTRHW